MVTLIKVWELGMDMNMLKINKQLTQQQNFQGEVTSGFILGAIIF